MWTDDQLNVAKYVVFHEQESSRPLNVGTLETPMMGLGPYLMTPVPPFGSLGAGGTIEGLKQGVRVPLKQYAMQFTPQGFPSPANGDSMLHQYGDGSV